MIRNRFGSAECGQCRTQTDYSELWPIARFIRGRTRGYICDVCALRRVSWDSTLPGANDLAKAGLL